LGVHVSFVRYVLMVALLSLLHSPGPHKVFNLTCFVVVIPQVHHLGHLDRGPAAGEHLQQDACQIVSRTVQPADTSDASGHLASAQLLQ
jgi:hypothetical protein